MLSKLHLYPRAEYAISSTIETAALASFIDVMQTFWTATLDRTEVTAVMFCSQ